MFAWLPDECWVASVASTPLRVAELLPSAAARTRTSRRRLLFFVVVVISLLHCRRNARRSGAYERRPFQADAAAPGKVFQFLQREGRPGVIFARDVKADMNPGSSRRVPVRIMIAGKGE